MKAAVTTEKGTLLYKTLADIQPYHGYRTYSGNKKNFEDTLGGGESP